jgi:hypothetical protein
VATSAALTRPARRAAVWFGIRQEEGADPSGSVGQRGGEGGVFHFGFGSGVDSASEGVIHQDVGVSGPQTETGRLLPAVGEAVDLVELDCSDPFHQQAEQAACGGAGQLLMIAHQYQFGAAGHAQPGQLVDLAS